MFQRCPKVTTISISTHALIPYVLLALAVTTAATLVIYHRALIKKHSRTKFYDEIHKTQTKQCEGTWHVAVWDKDVCEKTFENLAEFPKYPLYPDRFYCAENLSSAVENTEQSLIKRVQYYIQPIESGLYKFRARSTVALRIFLETNHQSPKIALILESSRGQNGIVYSKDYLLTSHRSYYFELIFFCHPAEENSSFDVDWLAPGSTQFRPIRSRDFKSVHHVAHSQHALSTGVNKSMPPNQYILLGFIPRIHIVKSFPPCSSQNFTPSEVAEETAVHTFPNPPTPEMENLAQFISRSFQKVVPNKYPSFKIMKIESNQNSTQFKHRRLLIDLELVVDGLDYKQRMSEYFFSWNNESNVDLCRPSHYHWNHFVTLNFLYLTNCHENRSVWADYFIQNMIEILQTSLDVNLKVIVTTCDEEATRSYDLNLRSSAIGRYAVVLLEGVYTKSRALKAALSLVEEDNSIVVLCESRVKMPTVIVEEIRKHTFDSTMAYSPIPYQLECGYFPDSRRMKGEWCAKYGSLLSLYKHDWNRILTDETEESQLWKDGRGEIFRRCSNFGIEITRVKLKALYRL